MARSYESSPHDLYGYAQYPSLMPKKRAQKKTKKGKGPNLSGQTNWVNPRHLSMFGFPDRFNTTLSFWEQNNPTWTAEGSKSFIFRGTSPWDPRVAAGGLSAEYFDQLALVYQTYRVTRSRCSVKFANSATAGVPFTVIVAPMNVDPGSPTTTTIISWANNAYGKKKLIGYTATGVLNSQMDTQRMYGSEAVLTDDNFSSLVTTNPANNWFWCVGAYLNASLTATGALYLDIGVEYDVQFYDRAVITDAQREERMRIFKQRQLMHTPPNPPPKLVFSQ